MGAFTCFHAWKSLQCIYSAMVDSTFFVCGGGRYMCVCMSVCMCMCLCVCVCACVCLCGCVCVEVSEIARPISICLCYCFYHYCICLNMYTTKWEIKSYEKKIHTQKTDKSKYWTIKQKQTHATTKENTSKKGNKKMEVYFNTILPTSTTTLDIKSIQLCHYTVHGINQFITKFETG